MTSQSPMVLEKIEINFKTFNLDYLNTLKSRKSLIFQQNHGIIKTIFKNRKRE